MKIGNYQQQLKKIKISKADCRQWPNSCSSNDAKAYKTKLNENPRLACMEPQKRQVLLLRKSSKNTKEQVFSIILDKKFLEDMKNQACRGTTRQQQQVAHNLNSNCQIPLSLSALKLKDIHDDPSKSFINRPPATQSVQVQVINQPLHSNYDAIHSDHQAEQMPNHYAPLQNSVESVNADGQEAPIHKPLQTTKVKKMNSPKVNHLQQEASGRRKYVITQEFQLEEQTEREEPPLQAFIIYDIDCLGQYFVEIYCHYKNNCYYQTKGQIQRLNLGKELNQKKRYNIQLAQNLEKLRKQYQICKTEQHPSVYPGYIYLAQTVILLQDWSKITEFSKIPQQFYIVDQNALRREASRLCSRGVDAQFYGSLVQTVKQTQPACIFLQQQIRQLTTNIGYANVARNSLTYQTQMMIQSYEGLYAQGCAEKEGPNQEVLHWQAGLI